MRIPRQSLREVAGRLDEEQMAGLIDHTELKPHVLRKKIRSLCDEADTHSFATVCINSCWVREASQYLKSRSSQVGIASVVGFPLGQMSTESKAFETSEAIAQGATEIDMVINVGTVRDMTASFGDERRRMHDLVQDDVEAVVKRADGAPVKVILETGYLTDEEISEACRISEEAGAAFVKTSTGFGPWGAYPVHLKLMRDTVGDRLGVKAAGGVTNFVEAIRSIYAAANSPSLLRPDRFRIGTSNGINIINSLNWAKYDDSWFVEEVPCKICPSNYVSKQPLEIQAVYVKKCRTCPDNAYRKFKDF
ncbi:MAG TPA: deoxyribose-phosphate aldolase [Candidatus Acidoferrum sp.]|nr:deoxyribose-phosphate aldolase [Candidatus Acidoferrum sp.]